jgi:hypothetical protein
MLTPAFGEHILLMRLEHGEATDLIEIARKAPFIGKHRKRCSHIFSSFGSLTTRQARGSPPPWPAALPLYKRFDLVRIEASGFKTW